MTDSMAFSTLPALQCLGRLGDVRPVVVVDTREQLPLPFRRLESVRGTLATGDYSFQGGENLFAVERKSVDDLAACCAGRNRERFMREMHRMQGFRFRRLIVIGSMAAIEAGEYVSDVSPQAILGTVGVLEARFGVGVVVCASPESAGQLVEFWAYYCAREIVQQANTLARAAGLTGCNGSGTN